MGSSKGTAKKIPTLSQKKKSTKNRKKKNDLALLEDALVSSAEKKSRAQKRAHEEKKQAQLKRQQDKQTQKQQEEPEKVDPLLQNTDTMLNVQAGRSTNKQIMQEGVTSGLDAGLASLTVGGSGGEAKSQKALYKEFEARMLPIVKEEYPGLRLSQYQEKVFGMWKKSPENPMNQQV